MNRKQNLLCFHIICTIIYKNARQKKFLARSPIFYWQQLRQNVDKEIISFYAEDKSICLLPFLSYLNHHWTTNFVKEKKRTHRLKSEF